MTSPEVGLDRTSGPDRPRPTEISVVIPVRNNTATIDVQLHALTLQDFEGAFEVVIADNGSTDGMQDKIRRHPTRATLDLRWIDASGTVGECHGRNEGVRASQYDFIACCDADDQVSQTWLSALAAAATAVDIVGGSLEKTTLNDPVVAAWREVPDPAALPVCGNYLPYAQGCNTAFWKNAWQTIGGFDESLIAGGGDIEFCWRAQLAGLQLGYAADAVIAYRFRTSLTESWRQVTTYGRGQAKVVARYRDRGAGRAPLAQLFNWIALIIVNSPILPWNWSRKRFGSWLWTVGGLWGCMSGGISERYLYF
ncbi:glycosyltransferase [Nocardia sp. R7R-8]|uniref:glycosyltransferase n=1 Tax=Nocardia sp. R7R-8 TaxID=3459304 RepID=UPI00403D843E